MLRPEISKQGQGHVPIIARWQSRIRSHYVSIAKVLHRANNAGISTATQILHSPIEQLHNWRNPSRPVFLCGGAQLTKNFVITAAHCFSHVTADEFSYYYVLLNDYSAAEESGIQVESEVLDIRVHPDFEAVGDGPFPNDIALVELKTPATSEFTAFLCLPDPGICEVKEFKSWRETILKSLESDF